MNISLLRYGIYLHAIIGRHLGQQYSMQKNGVNNKRTCLTFSSYKSWLEERMGATKHFIRQIWCNVQQILYYSLLSALAHWSTIVTFCPCNLFLSRPHPLPYLL